MAASQEQKVDYLLKKIGYVSSKTGIAEDSSLTGTKKAPFAEPIPSPLVVPSTFLWADSTFIPSTPPGSTGTYVEVYATASAYQMTVDNTVSGNRTFIARATAGDSTSAIEGDWIDPSFGSDYVIKVFRGDPNAGGVQLSAAGSGSNDTWFFDYSSGVLNFNGTVVPTGVTSTNIYLVGYRYVGAKGLTPPAGIATFTSLHVSGLSTFVGVGTFQDDLFVAGNLNVIGDLVYDEVTGRNINITGIATIGTTLDVNGTLDVDGDTQLDDLTVTGVATFSSLVDVNNRIDVIGGINADQVNVSGVSTLTGNVSFGSSAFFGDGDIINMGDSNDLQIFHSGVTGNIKNTTGTLILQSGTVRIQDAGSSETAFSATDGVAKLYFENSEKLTTTEKGIDVTGHSELDDVNVSGVATISTLEVTQATTLKHADSVKFTTTGIGISVANGVGQTAYIEGPDEIWIDPHPVGVGTTSGVVRIRGDLYVDGTQFIVNSDVIELADFVVGIASTVPTNLLLDGAGIGIGSESIRKFIRWHNATDSLKSSENWNLASGKHYEIDGTDVLTSDTLGSGVLYSSLETLGVLRGLDVSGVSTFSSLVDVNNRIDVVGGINADQANVTGVSTFGGNITASGDLDVDGTTDLDILNVAETATFSALVDVNNRIDIVGGANIDQVNAGLSSFTQLDVSTGGLDVDGQTDLDELVVAGVSTFSSLVDVDNRIDVVGGASVDQLNVSGVSTFAGISTFSSDVFVDGNLNVTGDLVFDELTATHANITGVATIANLLVTGVSTFQNHVHLGDSDELRFGDDNDLKIFHNGSHSIIRDEGTGVLYLQGDADVRLTDVGGNETYGQFNKNSSVDLYFDNVKKFETTNEGVLVSGGTTTGTLSVSGVSTFSGLVDVNNRIDVVGGANVDQVNVSGVSTFTGNADFGGNITVTSTDAGSSAAPEFKLYRDSSSPADADYLGQIKFAGESDTGVERNYAKITGKILDASNGTEDGILEFAHIKNGSQNISARFRSDSLQLLNGTNFSVNGNTELDGTLDVDGTATFDDVAVGSALTVTGIGTFQSDLYVAGNLNVIGDIVYDEVTGNNINITGVGTIASLQVSDLTDNRVVIAGTGGELEDDGNLTFNGTKLSVGVELDVDGQTELDELRVAGVSTFVGMSTFTDTLSANTLSVAGVSTFIGIGSFFSDLYVGGNLNVVGDLVYDEVTGRNINITGISTFEGESNIGVGGTTLTALTNVSRVGINSTVPEYTLDVGGDINSSTDIKIGGVSVLSSAQNDAVALAIALG